MNNKRKMKKKINKYCLLNAPTAQPFAILNSITCPRRSSGVLTSRDLRYLSNPSHLSLVVVGVLRSDNSGYKYANSAVSG
jgi:hypothetical protein